MNRCPEGSGWRKKAAELDTEDKWERLCPGQGDSAAGANIGASVLTPDFPPGFLNSSSKLLTKSLLD